MSFGNVNDSNNRVHLYTSSINNNFSSVGDQERFGDRETSHYVIVYLGWEAIEYNINISLNNFGNGIYNYGSADAGYQTVLDQTYNLRPDTIIAYTTNATNYLTFTIKFDSLFSEALTTRSYGGRRYSLSELMIYLTGYKLTSLNTNTNKTDPNNVAVVTYTGGIGICNQTLTLSYETFQKVFYQKIITSGNDKFSNIYSLYDNFKEVGSDYIQIRNFKETNDNNVITLFAGYEINRYTVTAENAEDNININTGYYKLINLLNSTTFAQSQSQTIDFYSDEHIVIVPKTSGYYLSKINLEYTSTSDGRRYYAVFNIDYQSSSRSLLISSVQIIDAETGAVIETIYSNEIPSMNINYVFDSITLTSYGYNTNPVVFDPDMINETVQWEGWPGDVFYSVLTIGNVKTNISVSFEYAIQEYETNIYINISSDGKINIDSDSNIYSHEIHEYGTPISEIANEWDNILSGSNIRKVGWFEVIFDEDGGYTTQPVAVDDPANIINREIHLVCSYITDDGEDSKRVIFYTWQGGVDGNYVEYANNSVYVLRSTSYEYDADSDDTISSSKHGYIYNNGVWGWTAGYEANANNFTNYQTEGDKLLYANLQRLPSSSIGSWYPDSEFICYVVLRQDDLSALGDYDFISAFATSGNYIRVTNYYIENGITYVNAEVVNGETGNVVKDNLKLEVLSTTTKIDENVYALQAYSQLSFTISKDENYENENFEYDSSNGNLTINVDDYLSTVNYFEVDGNNVTYYSSVNGDYVQLVVLNAVQYETYLYARSTGSSIATALETVLQTYKDIEVVNLEQTATAGSYILNMVGESYVFMFYYRHGSSSSIVTVCDTYMSNTSNKLNYYPTSNSVSFTTSSVSVYTTTTESETLVSININQMNTNYTDETGAIYNRNDMLFVLLNAQMLNNYFTNFSSMTKEQALEKLFEDNPDLTYSSETTYTVTSNTYIIAFYKSGDRIVKVTSNYAYINNSNHSRTIIYIRDLMFTESISSDSVSNITETTFNFTLDINSMFTTKYDYLTGINYNIDDYNLHFVVFNGSQFKTLTDYVANGFMNINTALKNALASSENYSSNMIASKSAQTIAFNNLLVNTDYYILAYYIDANNNIAVISANVLMINYSTDSGIFNFDVTTLSNNFGFTISSIIAQQVNGVGQISFDIEKMNSIYFNYIDKSELNTNNIRFVEVSAEELEIFAEYYNNGAEIVYNDMTNVYDNLTFEEALELTLYYYRQKGVTGNNTFEFNLASGNYSIEEAINRTNVIQPDYISTLSLPDPETTAVETHYIIAIYLNDDGKIFNKVSNNIVKVDYAKNENGQITLFEQSVVSISSIFGK